jgi:hypothetical protein
MKPVSVSLKVPAPLTRSVIRRANDRSLHRLAETLASLRS